MTAAVAFLASYVVSAAWQVPVLCIAGWLASLLLRRLGPAAQHRVWMAVLLLCVMVPSLPAPRIHGSGVNVAIEQAKVHTSSATTVGSSNAWAPPAWVPLWLLQSAAAVWLLSVLYGAVKLLLAYRATQELVAGAEPLTESAVVDAALQRCRQALALREVDVMVSDRIAGPVTLRHDGRDVLLLPAHMLAEVSQQDVFAAVAHECAHMQRRDFTTHLLLSVLALPVRFHPLMERVHGQMAATREMSCDAVAASLHGPSYRDGLLRLAQWIADTSTGRPALAMGFAVGIFDSNSLEDRMQRLIFPASHLHRAARMALVFAAVAAMAGTASALAVHGMHLLPSTASAASADAMTEPRAAMEPSPVPQAALAPSPAHRAKVVQPKLVYQVDPEFPQEGRSAGIVDRLCKVGLTVDTDGVPQDVHVVQTAGQAFDANALKAVKQYRFKPAMRDGRPVAMNLTVAVDFQIF